MLGVMPRLYGERITDAESAELIAKLRARGTRDAISLAVLRDRLAAPQQGLRII